MSAQLDRIQVRFQEKISLINFRFWQEKSISKSLMEKQLYEAEQEAIAQIRQLMLDVVGDDELVQKTDDVQEIDLSQNNAEVRNNLRAALRNAVKEGSE
jgi:hypothetical protein